MLCMAPLGKKRYALVIEFFDLAIQYLLRVYHLCFASERGFGPMKLDQIDLAGDFPLEEVRARH